MAGRLAGKTALIGGGAGGAGRAASLLFAREGASIGIADRQAELGQRTVEEIRRSGGNAVFFETDVSRADQVERAVQGTMQAFGPIQILFNHAGTVIVKHFLETSEEDWDWLMAVNVKSMFLMSKAVLPSMLEAGGGSIINTSSISGITASALESVYCVSKGAVLQLTRSITAEFRTRGIRCNAILPGLIQTDHGLREMRELIALGEDWSDDVIVNGQVRPCDPEEVAKAALFLASDEASFINGAALVVDNGWTAVT